MEEPNTDKPSVTVYYCCVRCCTNDSRYDKEKAHTFHKFPKDSTKKQRQWIFKIRGDLGSMFKVSFKHVDCSI